MTAHYNYLNLLDLLLNQLMRHVNESIGKPSGEESEIQIGYD